MASQCLLRLEFIDYIKYAIPVYAVELLAAIAGIFYLLKVPAYNLVTKYFIWFLWFTVMIELIGSYAPIAYFTDYDYLSFVKDTRFEKNKWLYNFYSLVSASFYTYYFGTFIKSKNWKLILKFLLIAFIVSSVLNLIFSDVLFEEDSKYVNLGGTFLIFFAVILFYFDLLKSDRLLNLKRFLPLYVSIGVMIFYLCVTPLSIFSDYFNSENSLFVKLQVHLILFSNIFMYSFFILGFYICSRKKRSF
jgi:hypothetical protein